MNRRTLTQDEIDTYTAALPLTREEATRSDPSDPSLDALYVATIVVGLYHRADGTRRNGAEIEAELRRRQTVNARARAEARAAIATLAAGEVQ